MMRERRRPPAVPGSGSTRRRRPGSRRGGVRPAAVLVLAFALLTSFLGCGGDGEDGGKTVTISASSVGAEAEVLRAQLGRFMEQHPEITVEVRETPDAADQRHQLYVQWLNARGADPDILQLDVIWTPEFAAAGWVLPLNGFNPDEDDFFAATLEANVWRGRLHALPWFADAGMLYWRTDLVDRAPQTFEEMKALAAGMSEPEFGFIWQGARYEGLVCVFLEVLGGFGGRILDDANRVAVDSPAGVAALEFLQDGIYEEELSPEAVLTWQEEPVRFAFQNGSALFMRNWPYAYSLLSDSSDSRVAGRFAVSAMPAAPGGEPTAALGGSQLAINANSDQPEAAWKVIDFLTQPEQMLERARAVGQFPARKSLYASGRLDGVLPVPADDARRVIEAATPRPVTPVYTELSQTLQVWLHRALTNQVAPEEALEKAAEEMAAVLDVE
ncbi:MAG: extracellular solute-binding protein [Candidatus Eisenbacteria bacterium]|nr:extracellular solute-binding protein [Candidatus Eisenbacteria bacterium]